MLLSADGRTAKVADIGAAKMMDAEYVSQHFGTLAWAAPELLLADQSSQLDEKVNNLQIPAWVRCQCKLAADATCKPSAWHEHRPLPS